jgi:hypothetical protein
VVYVWETGYAYRVLVGKLVGNHLEDRWDSNIKMVLKEMGCEGVDWINLAHDRTSGWFLCTEQ